MHNATGTLKMPYLEEAGPVDNDSDDESIGNTFRGTVVSPPGYSERSVQEYTAYTSDILHSGHSKTFEYLSDQPLFSVKSSEIRVHIPQKHHRLPSETYQPPLLCVNYLPYRYLAPGGRTDTPY